MIEFNNVNALNALEEAKTISRVAPVSEEAVGIIFTVLNAINELPYNAKYLNGFHLSDWKVPECIGAAVIHPASITINGDPDTGIDFKAHHYMGQPVANSTVNYTPDDFHSAWVDLCRPLRTQGKVTATLKSSSDYRTNKELSAYFPKADGEHLFAMLNHTQTNVRNVKLEAMTCIKQDFFVADAGFFLGFPMSKVVPLWYKAFFQKLSAL